jgi:hypothetical protein
MVTYYAKGEIGLHKLVCVYVWRSKDLENVYLSPWAHWHKQVAGKKSAAQLCWVLTSRIPRRGRSLLRADISTVGINWNTNQYLSFCATVFVWFLLHCIVRVFFSLSLHLDRPYVDLGHRHWTLCQSVWSCGVILGVLYTFSDFFYVRNYYTVTM